MYKHGFIHQVVAIKLCEFHLIILIEFKYEFKLHFASFWKKGVSNIWGSCKTNLSPIWLFQILIWIWKAFFYIWLFNQSWQLVFSTHKYRRNYCGKYSWTDIENTLSLRQKQTNTHVEKLGKWLHVWMNGAKVNKWRQILVARQHWSMDIAALTTLLAPC